MRFQMTDAFIAAQRRGDRSMREMSQTMARAQARADRLLGRTVNLMTPGQKVSIKDHELQLETQRGVTFTVEQVVGAGADSFCSLRAPDNSISEWLRISELQ